MQTQRGSINTTLIQSISMEQTLVDSHAILRGKCFGAVGALYGMFVSVFVLHVYRDVGIVLAADVAVAGSVHQFPRPMSGQSLGLGWPTYCNGARQ